MTRKDYIALAAALADARRSCETRNQERGVERAVATIAAVLASDNARFDRARFDAACLAVSRG